MKLTVIGTGYVGLTSGAMFAELGHQVTCVDKDKDKVKMLKTGKVPFYEPGLDNLVRKHLDYNIKFTTSLSAAEASKVIMIAVGTPPAKDGSPDLSFVLEVARQLIPYLKEYKVIIMKSTVPIGTNKIVQKYLLDKGVERKNFDIVSNPEFLREGTAIFDSFHPDRIVIGSDSQKATEITRSLYQRIECPVMITSNEAAEMIKYASNAFLAVKISFVNELAGICENYKVDICEVARGVGYDTRIGPHFLKAGAGFGGSCLPKDLSGLLHLADKADKKAKLLKAVYEVNTDQPALVIAKLEKLLGALQDKKIAVWGLSFKPETDDMRFAPAIPVINLLLQKQALVSAFDPAAMENAKKLLPASVKLSKDMYEAVRNCDALVIMTEWDIFALADIKLLKETMKNPVIVDGRNIFSPSKMISQGFQYRGIGR
ncbi:MAG: UDP-glucose dehydrogenase family protein [Eubacteriales bacterium]